MHFNTALRLVVLLLLGGVPSLRAQSDSWTYWGSLSYPNGRSVSVGAKLATDGTNLVYSTILDGVYRASLADRQFSAMPMTGFPLWSDTNTNGFGVWNLAVTPQGTVVISGSPVVVSSNNISASPAPNSLPILYFWDEASNQWHPAAITGKTYPYTSFGGNFSVGPDGALWTCSGFASYAYRSTDGGRSYTALDINARVPANYFPLYNGSTTFGKVFSILVTPANEVIVGTETGGFLHSLDNGQSWSSLDPHFTDPNTTSPLGRIGNAVIAGLDRYGNVLLDNPEMAYSSPAYPTWSNVKLIEYRPTDGGYVKADNGIPSTVSPATVLTTPAGDSFFFASQNNQLTGGVFRSQDGTHWTQFNNGIPALTTPFAPGITNAVTPNNCLAACGTLVFVGAPDQTFWTYDTAPQPVTNHHPTAAPQNFNLVENTPISFTLDGADLDGDLLNFTITVPPAHGQLSGWPPNLTYTPSNNFTGLDFFYFTTDDGVATSPAALVNLVINPPTNPPPTISLTCLEGTWPVGPTNLSLVATASSPVGIRRINYYAGTNLLGAASNAPYVLIWTNPAPGDYTLAARAIDNNGGRAWSTPLLVSVLPAQPRLSLYSSDPTHLSVSWPLALQDFYSETTTNLAGPWTLCPTPIWDTSSVHTVTVPMTDAQWFRLNHPR